MIYRRTDIATTKHAVNYLPCRLSATQAEPYDPSQHDIRPGSFKLWNKTQGMLQLYYSDSDLPNGMWI